MLACTAANEVNNVMNCSTQNLRRDQFYDISQQRLPHFQYLPACKSTVCICRTLQPNKKCTKILIMPEYKYCLPRTSPRKTLAVVLCHTVLWDLPSFLEICHKFVGYQLPKMGYGKNTWCNVSTCTVNHKKY